MARGSNSSGTGDKNVTETNASSKESVIVNASFSPVNVLELDAKGAILMFDGKDGFVELADEVVAQLSADNKRRYAFAREFHLTWRGSDQNRLSESISVDRQSTGTPLQKISTTGKKGLRFRWCRPELVDARIGQGYRIANADDAKSYAGARNGVHRIGVQGRDELVLMAMPEQMYAERQIKKAEKNAKAAGAYRESFKQEAARTGLKPYDEATDKGDGRRWTEQQSLDD